MEKRVISGAFLVFSLLGFAYGQTTDKPAEPTGSVTVTTNDVNQPVSKSALSAARFEGNLNQAVLYKTVLDYTLPDEIYTLAKKCAATDSDECYIALKSYENDPQAQVASAANLELAVLAMQRGQIKQSLLYIEKAAELNPDDPFIQLTQGWLLLSAGKYKKAHKAFEDLFYLTADFEYVSSAKLGDALTWYFGGRKEKAAAQLQYLYTSNPYVISFVSYMLGRIASETKNGKKLAPVFLQQALSHDEKNYAAAELIAKISEKEKNHLPAWQYYATLYGLDPENKTLSKKVATYQQEFGDKSIDYLFYSRLEQPIVHLMPSTKSQEVKMALYANRKQEPQELISAAVVGSGIIVASDDKLGEILRVPSYVEKTISFNPETLGVDVKDARGHVEFSAKRPFTLSPDKDKYTLLVRNVRAENIFVANLSDKELKGSLTVIPTEHGFKLVNQVRAEDLIPALLATQARDVKQPAALTALAVVFRAALADVIARQSAQPYHITDNDDTFRFDGVNLIFKEALEASKKSAATSLTEAQAGFYTGCGVVTADRLENTASKPGYLFSPANVSKYILSNPPADLYSRPQDPTQWASIKWIYLYDAKEIEDRLSYKQDIGHLQAITPLTYTPNGRVLTVRFVGSKATYETQSPQETAFILSAGTMRSNLFDIVPLYKGKTIKSVLVRGYDTGLGSGLCLSGAEGLAKQGADYMAIIKYYFPQARILNTATGKVH